MNLVVQEHAVNLLMLPDLVPQIFFLGKASILSRW